MCYAPLNVVRAHISHLLPTSPCQGLIQLYQPLTPAPTSIQSDFHWYFSVMEFQSEAWHFPTDNPSRWTGGGRDLLFHSFSFVAFNCFFITSFPFLFAFFFVFWFIRLQFVLLLLHRSFFLSFFLSFFWSVHSLYFLSFPTSTFFFWLFFLSLLIASFFFLFSFLFFF